MEHFVFKKSLLNIGCYDEKFYFAQDYKLMKEMVDNKYKFKYLHKPYYFLNMKIIYLQNILIDSNIMLSV